jgi:hypothetical protein
MKCFNFRTKEKDSSVIIDENMQIKQPVYAQNSSETHDFSNIGENISIKRRETMFLKRQFYYIQDASELIIMSFSFNAYKLTHALCPYKAKGAISAPSHAPPHAHTHTHTHTSERASAHPQSRVIKSLIHKT